MANSIVVAEMGRWDGTYDLGTEDRVFNGREWHWIKKVSGYMPATIAEGFSGQDPDLFIALAVIAMVRSGKLHREQALVAAEELAELPYTGRSITLTGYAAEEADEVPLGSGRRNGESSPNASPSRRDTPTPNESSSGPTLPTGSERLAATQ